MATARSMSEIPHDRHGMESCIEEAQLLAFSWRRPPSPSAERPPSAESNDAGCSNRRHKKTDDPHAGWTRVDGRDDEGTMIRDPECAVWMQNATPTNSDIEDLCEDLPNVRTHPGGLL